jgi:hypothetical protein
MRRDQCETFVTMWHPEAEAELAKVRDGKERYAIHTAIDKVRRNGPKICAPHRKQVQGVAGLHSLRPRGGRSIWRVLYACSGERRYLLLAVTRTPRVSPRVFRSGVEKACRRAQGCGLKVG